MIERQVHVLRKEVFSQHWPLDEQITDVTKPFYSHRFLSNPASQYLYVYLSRFAKALSERYLQRPFGELSVLDWGCGKGHVSKLLRDLGPKHIESCDRLSDHGDSAFGQETPIVEKFNIAIRPLEHDYVLPYEDNSFDVVLSVGVLEHVPDDRASLVETKRILRPGGLFFCFFLPTDLSWTQKLAHLRGEFYHDRFYNPPLIKKMLAATGLDLLDVWYRQILPKNSVPYPFFRSFERLDQLVTEHTPLRVFATNVEFLSAKPGVRETADS